jgi:DNA repair exonuclease SbcCD ATPase subunit
MDRNVDIDRENVDLDQVGESVTIAEELREQLDQSVRALPPVDEDGNSECPAVIAEELYARKEELQERLSARLRQLYEDIEAIDAEILRCRSNLTVVGLHEGRIHSPNIRDQYSQEEVRLAARIKRLEAAREAVEQAIKATQQAIAVAAGHYYPGKRPRKTPGPRERPPVDMEPELDELASIDQERLFGGGP